MFNPTNIYLNMLSIFCTVVLIEQPFWVCELVQLFEIHNKNSTSDGCMPLTIVPMSYFIKATLCHNIVYNNIKDEHEEASTDFSQKRIFNFIVKTSLYILRKTMSTNLACLAERS